MRKDLTAVEVIGVAIRSEGDAAAFYARLAGLVKNDLVREKYKQLAKEEEGHRHVLINLYKKMTGEKNPPEIPEGIKTAESGDVQEDPSDIDKLLTLAIKREQQASAFYRQAAKKATDTTGKRTLEYLADVEHGHEALLVSELEAYRRDRNWYAEHPDIQLVGP